MELRLHYTAISIYLKTEMVAFRRIIVIQYIWSGKGPFGMFQRFKGQITFL